MRPCVVGVDLGHPLVAKADELQRRKQRRVRVRADQHMHRRRAEQAIGIGIPSRLEQRAGARRGKAGAVGDGGAGRKPDGAVARQVEQFEQPALRNLLERRGGGGGGVIAGILAPGADQPVGGHAGRLRRAHHPGEKPRADGRHQPALGQRRHLVDDRQRVGALSRAAAQRSARASRDSVRCSLVSVATASR